MHRFALLIAFSLFPTAVISQTATTLVEGAEYRVLTVKSPVDGQPVHLLVCNNGTTECTYKWDELCAQGKAVNTDPMGGVGGDTPAFIRDKTGTPMRMFVCKG